MSKSGIRQKWITTTLGSFMDFKNGINADKDAYGKGVKFVNVMDIFKNNSLASSDIIGSVSITDKQIREYSVVYGDILFNRTSETRNEIAFSSVYIGNKTITFGGFVIRGRQKKQLLIPEYAKYCFKHKNIRKEMIRRCQGAIRANIGQKDLSRILIIIPPLREQKAIASLLEKWDTAIEKTEALIAAKEKQFRWLLKTLINDQQSNPEWQEVKLGEIGTIFSGGTPSTQDATNWGGDILWLTPTEVTKSDRKYISATKRKITRKGLSSTTLLPPKCLIVCTRATIGNCCINTVPMSMNQGFKAVHPRPNYLVLFLYYVFLLQEKNLIRLSCGNTFREISKNDFQNISMKMPPLPEQKAIASLLEKWDTAIEKSKALAEQYRIQKHGLMQKLLTGEWQATTPS